MFLTHAAYRHALYGLFFHVDIMTYDFGCRQSLL